MPARESKRVSEGARGEGMRGEGERTQVAYARGGVSKWKKTREGGNEQRRCKSGPARIRQKPSARFAHTSPPRLAAHLSRRYDRPEPYPRIGHREPKESAQRSEFEENRKGLEETVVGDAYGAVDVVRLDGECELREWGEVGSKREPEDEGTHEEDDPSFECLRDGWSGAWQWRYARRKGSQELVQHLHARAGQCIAATSNRERTHGRLDRKIRRSARDDREYIDPHKHRFASLPGGASEVAGCERDGDSLRRPN